MEKMISFANGLAVASIVLTIVLVVLDKAGKLHGPVLIWLLAAASLMLLPFALGNSWVTDAPFGLKIARGLLIFFVVGAAFSALAVWVLPDNEVAEGGPRSHTGKASILFGEGPNATGSAMPIETFESGEELVAYAGGPDDTSARIRMKANGDVTLDVDVKDGNGNSVITIHDGEFKVAPNADLDSNSQGNAYEAIDKDGLVVFQLTRKAPAEIVICGVFKMKIGTYFLAGPKGPLETNKVRYDYAPKRIFKYPSWRYPGKFATEP